MTLLAKIETEYGIKVLHSTKVRDVYRLKTNRHGTLCLKKYNESGAEVAFITRVLQYLRNSGFHYSPKLMRTGSHQHLLGRGAFQYTLTNWVAGRAPDFNQAAEWGKAIDRLAHFHSHAHGFPVSQAPSERLRYDHLVDNIQGYKHTLKSHHSMERFASLCDQAIALLSQEHALKAVEKERLAGAFVHGDYNYPNLVLDHAKRMHLIDFENSSLQARMTDLAHILYRNHAWRSKGMLRAIAKYDHRRPLSKEDRHLLHALLHVPYPLVRILRRKSGIRQKGNLPSAAEIERYTRRLQQLL